MEKKNWIKKNWQLILIVVLAIFGFSKCTQSCNRQGTINKQNVELTKLDSITKAQESQIQFLIKDTTDYLNQIRLFKGFDKTRTYTDSVNAENLKKQREQTQTIINQNQKLIQKVQKNK